MQPCLNERLASGINSGGSKRVALAQAAAVGTHALRAVEAEELRAGGLEAQAAVRAGVMSRELQVRHCGRAPRQLLRRLRPSASTASAGFCRRAPIVGWPRPDDQIAVAQLQRQFDGFGRPSADLQCRPSAGRRRPRSCAASGDRAADRRSDVTTRPSTRARAKPCLRRSSNRSRYSPFWPRRPGPATGTRVPSGSVPMRSMICSRLWAVIGRPHFGQWPVPDAGKQHPQVVVNLGDRADGRPRVLPARSSARSKSPGSGRRSGRRPAWASGPRNCRAKLERLST